MDRNVRRALIGAIIVTSYHRTVKTQTAGIEFVAQCDQKGNGENSTVLVVLLLIHNGPNNPEFRARKSER